MRTWAATLALVVPLVASAADQVGTAGRYSQAPATEQRIVEQQTALPEPVVSDAGLTWKSGDYTYDGVGNIVTIGTPAAPGTQGYRTYGYDALSRLTTAQIGGVTPGASYEYAYDVYGNRTSAKMNQQPMTTPAVAAATNQLSGNDYAYDTAGNQTINGSSVATWDGFAMMTSYRFGTTAANTNTFVYTASDERIGVLRGSEWTWTLRRPDGKPLRQYRSSASADTEWVWVEDFVYRDGALLASEREAEKGGIRHYHLDHLGSARLVTSATGSLLSEHDFLPFGGERTAIDQHTSLGFDREEPLRYTGHERDFENADPNDSSAYIDYMHARYYGPNTGRFLSVDPVLDLKSALKSPQMWNRYAYVHDNPVNKIDPDGRLAYHWHYWITYRAARADGMSRRDARSLAWAVVKVDHREGSQGKDARASNTHAMRGAKEDGKSQTIKEGRQGTENSIASAIWRSDLAEAIHTAQDRAAPGHADQVWKGSKNPMTILHVKEDVAPAPITVGIAFVNTLNVLSASRERNLNPNVYSGTVVQDDE